MNRETLFEQINEHYSTIQQTIEFEGLSLEVLKCEDADKALEEAVESEKGDQLSSWQPYWAEAWESAIAMGAWLIEHNLSPCNAIDLGCGLGVAGCVAAHLGSNVILADSAPPSLLFAQWNSFPWRDRVSVRKLNWNRDRLVAAHYDVIIGADILYEKESWIPQSEFFNYHLASEGEILLAEPNRGLSDNFQSVFEDQGWSVNTWMYHPPLIEKPIRMFRCIR